MNAKYMNKTEAKKRIEELNKILLAASEAYYNEDREIMSNFEYDKLYDELKVLEDKFDIHMSNSLTQNVGYTAADLDIQAVGYTAVDLDIQAVGHSAADPDKQAAACTQTGTPY